MGRISALLNPLTYVIINLSVLLIVWLGGVQVNMGNLQTGDVIALYNYMSQILIELIKMANFIILITKACASAGRINKIFDTPASLPTRKPEAAEQNGEKVSVRGVSLLYHKGAEQALQNITFSAAPGEEIGIIGGTGSGNPLL